MIRHCVTLFALAVIPSFCEDKVIATLESHRVSGAVWQKPIGPLESSAVSLRIPFADKPDGVAGLGTVIPLEGEVVIDYPAQTPTARPPKPGNYVVLDQPMRVTVTVSTIWRRGADGYTGRLWLRTPCEADIPFPLPKGESRYSTTVTCDVTVIGPYWNERAPLGLDLRVAPKQGQVYEEYYGLRLSVTTQYKVGSFTPPPSPDLLVDRLEPVQVVQTIDGSVPRVAGKETAVRVFAALARDTSTPVAGVTAVLRGYRDGVELPGSPLRPANGALTVGNDIERGRQDGSFNFKLPLAWTAAGTTRLAAEITPPAGFSDRDAANNRLESDAVFSTQTLRELKIGWWRVCYAPPGSREKTCPGGDLAGHDKTLAKLYPLAAGGLKYRKLPLADFIWRQPILTFGDANRLNVRLRKTWDLLTGTIDLDQLVAWFPVFQESRVGGLADAAWFENGGGRVAVVKGTEDALAKQLLAHEVGHNLGLRHPPTADACKAADPRSDWPHQDATIQDYGFDVATMTLVPATHKDVMTYCEPNVTWISPYHYRRLMASRGGADPNPGRPAKAGVRRAPSEEYLVISGTVRADGASARLDPAYQVSGGNFDSSLENGNHCLVFHDAQAELSRFCFTLNFITHDTAEPVEEESFSFKVPLPGGTTRVALVRGEQQLAELGGEGAPSVSIASPQAGERWSGVQTVRWTGSAAAYALLYSPDGGQTWMPLAADLAEQEYEVDTARLTSGASVHFRVVATNGLDNQSATVGPIEIAEAAQLSVAAAFDLGWAEAGQVLEATLPVRNLGNAPLSIQAAGIDSNVFAYTAELPLSIGAGATHDLPLRFSAAEPGLYKATLSIDGIQVALSAEVLAGVAPKLVVSAAELDFGDVAAGASAERRITVHNSGTSTLTLTQTSVSGAAFSASGPGTLAGGARGDLVVRFSPAGPAAETGTVRIASNGGSAEVSLRGTGRAARAEASPSALDFAAAGDRQLTLTNSGNADLEVTAAAFSIQQFSLVTALPVKVAPGAQQVLTVRYVPADPVVTGTLSLATNAGEVKIALRGAPLVPPRFSDSFNRAALGQNDNALGGRETFCYTTVFPAGAVISDNTLLNPGTCYGGVQLAPPGCGSSVPWRGTSVGQDLRISVRVLVPADAQGRVGLAGPYFRSRLAARADGIIGGESAGYWVQLLSTGEVKLKNLHTGAIVAAAAQPASFDASAWHMVEGVVQGEQVKVIVDGATRLEAAIPPTGGSNGGGAGVAFGCEPDRGVIGGQRADDLLVR